MHFVCISGIWCPEQPIAIWPPLARAFYTQFPHAQFCGPEQEAWIGLLEFDRLQRMCDRIVEKYDDGRKLILVGHSAGGVVATAIANRFQNSRVYGIVTIFSPHCFLGGVFPWMLGEKDRVGAPIVSFGASADELVWWGTRHPQSVSHTMLCSTHFSTLAREPELAGHIAATTKRILFPEA